MSFLRENKEKILVAVIILVLLSFISKTNVGRESITKLEKIIGNSLTPLNKLFSGVNNGVYKRVASIKDNFKLKEKNKKLNEKVIKLEAENRKLTNIVGKSDYLKRHYELLEKTDYELIESKVIAKEAGNWFDRFTIDKGINDGVKRGDIIVQGIYDDQDFIIEGLVGRIDDVGDNWSKVVAIVDERSSISFKVIRTQDGGIASGNKDSEIMGYLFDEDSDVIKGDKLYTSGLGGLFKQDLYIGEVTEVINDQEDMTKKVKIDPAVDFKKLYELFIISN